MTPTREKLIALLKAHLPVNPDDAEDAMWHSGIDLHEAAADAILQRWGGEWVKVEDAQIQDFDRYIVWGIIEEWGYLPREYVATFYFDTGKWMCLGNEVTKVTHYMSLPSPPTNL